MIGQFEVKRHGQQEMAQEAESGNKGMCSDLTFTCCLFTSYFRRYDSLRHIPNSLCYFKFTFFQV